MRCHRSWRHAETHKERHLQPLSVVGRRMADVPTREGRPGAGSAGDARAATLSVSYRDAYLFATANRGLAAELHSECLESIIDTWASRSEHS